MSSLDSPVGRLTYRKAAAQDAWFLVGPTGVGDTVRHVPVDQTPFVIGRKSGAALRLQFPTVSGLHAELGVAEGRLLLTDLGSTNGTFVNGKRLEGSTWLKDEDLIHFAEAPFRVRRQSLTGSVTGTICENVCDQALALVQFDRLMSQRLVRPHFQPIVRLGDARQVGHEVLGRGSVFGLESVSSMFHAAEQLELEVELSQMLRWEGIRVGRTLPESPMLFVNTHPKELLDVPSLLQSLTGLRDVAGETGLVLEIHEAAVTHPQQMQRLRERLQELGIQLAFDDFGSGQARLSELMEARPDVVKFDISLIHGVDTADSQRQRMLASLVQMVRDLGIQALAEGVETAEEANVCREIGFDLAQGFYYGRPAPA